jgi:polyphosphate glucokinase
MVRLGIDVGGSGIKGAIVDTKTGNLLTNRLRLKTPHPATPMAVIATIKKLVKEFKYTGPLGVGFPAIVLDGTVRSAANIDDSWIDYPGERRIAKATGCEVRLLNDADAAGIAEMRFGAGRKKSGVVLILTLGTGIGSALFVDGKLVPNMELGHLYLRGQAVDAEDYASDRIRTEEGLKWKEWATRLDEYFHHLELLLSPKMFILGGGVSKKYEKFVPYLTVQAKVVPAELRNEAGIIGAALAAEELVARN